MNCFPSLHISVAFIAALSCWKQDRVAGGAAFALASLITVSTFFVKQHYVVDAVAGIALATGVWAIVLRPHVRDETPERVRAARVGLAVYAGVYLAAIFGVCGTLYLVGFAPWAKR